jgi:hypothetical protein
VRDGVVQLAREASALLRDGQPRAGLTLALQQRGERRELLGLLPQPAGELPRDPRHGEQDGGHGDLALAARRPRLGERRAGQRDQPARDPRRHRRVRRDRVLRDHRGAVQRERRLPAVVEQMAQQRRREHPRRGRERKPPAQRERQGADRGGDEPGERRVAEHDLERAEPEQHERQQRVGARDPVANVTSDHSGQRTRRAVRRIGLEIETASIPRLIRDPASPTRMSIPAAMAARCCGHSLRAITPTNEGASK